MEDRIKQKTHPGFYEKLGLKYFTRLSEKDKKRGHSPIPDATDDELVSAVRKVTLLSCLIAFVVGGISAGGAVFTELYFKGEGTHIMYSWVAGVTVVLTAIEFAILFRVSIRMVFSISRITGHSTMEDNNKYVESVIPNLLTRAALEIPDPVETFLGIDPMARVSRRKLLLIGILYKLKIAASNVLAKLFLRRVAGKSILRVSVSYVAVFITGLWNAIVCFKVVREARLRLFGNLIAKHIVDNVITDEKIARLSQEARIGCMQAVGNAVVNAQRYHPNMMILLVCLAEDLNIKEGKNFDDWDIFLNTLDTVVDEERFFLLDLLCIAAAFDGKVSRIEKKVLGTAFREQTGIYFKRINRLKKLMMSGRLHEALGECKMDYEPG